jgi:DNA-binding CsgD family transcriptional regulator
MLGGVSAVSPKVLASGAPLLGREREREVLDRLLDGAREGRGGVVVLHGEAGVGKTALLEYAAGAGREFRIAPTSGVEAAMELPYAAVQQLCSPFFELMERLPEPQHDALAVAFGRSSGPAPNPFLVGLAVLGLLAEAAEQQPLAGIVDDAQWLDSASVRTLAFVARRLLAEKIALVFATRELGDTLAGLPELRIEPLGRRHARALLESVLPAPLDERVLERIVAETQGNPLALLELPRGMSPTQLAGGFGLPQAVPMSASIEESFMRRLATLPHEARRLLLVAAADPVGDPAIVWGAAERLGIPESAAHRVESEELLALSPRVVFRHPLIRSAVYAAAGLNERREVHRALAAATDPEVDPDRRAWHSAQAAVAPDEGVAAELERSADRAQARGGFAAAAAFLERAVALTPEPSRRAPRALAAAWTTFQAGALEDALGLLAVTEIGALDELDRARVELLRAQIAFVSRRGSDAPTMLLAAADRLMPLSPALAYETFLDALSAAMFAGRLAAPGARALDVALAAKAAPRPSVLSGPELLLDGLATFFCESYEAAVPILRRAQNAFDVSALPVKEQLRWKWLVAISFVHLWDDAHWEATSELHVRAARETGALSELPLALSQRVYVHLFAGELTAAAALVDEIRAATEATGSNLTPYGAVGLVALRGREPEAISLIDESRADATRRGEGIGISVLDWAQAVLYNGLGRYDEARVAALRAIEYPHDLGGPLNWGIVELIEAAVRAGTPEPAADARSRLAEMARVSGTDWALGIAARSEALCVEDQRAEELYVEAVDRLGRTRMVVDLARAHLLYGEWLRRQRRRPDARRQLRTAYDLFSGCGLEAFAERARLELEAAGERARKRTVETPDQLTPQETQIARLAAEGSTNREIALRLFISASTVEYHLRKAFRKLDVTSRTQLEDRLS